jgi:hypothetical protein
MPAPNLLQAVGAQAQKQTRFVSLFTSRFLSGLYTNRSLLRGPLQSLYSDFYHMGTTDALCDGLNSELSIRQTMIRRPGNPAYCSVNTAAAIDFFYAFHRADGTINVIADSTTDVEVVTPSSITSIFTKTSGAGESALQGINKSLYICDGIDTVKYIPGTTNPVLGGSVWNMAGAAPTTAPKLTLTQTGSVGVTWIASTVWTTMGLFFDGTNMHQLNSINADGNNATPSPANTGLSGNGQPVWNQAYLGVTVDGSVHWTNYGQIKAWQPNHLYAGGDPIYDPTTKCVFIASHNYNVTSGGTYPSFTATLGINGARVTESSGARWENIGIVESWSGTTPTCIRLWDTLKTYLHYDPPVNGTGGGDPTNVNCATIEPNTNLPSTTENPVYLQAATTAGTTGTATGPSWATSAGATTQDGNLGYICLGSGTWAANTAYAQWTPGGLFNAIKDANGNFQVCTVTGTSAALVPGTADSLTAASNASGGNTTYTGTFPVPFPAGSPVTISGFTNSANNGKFKVISCNATTLVANNSAGVAETHAGTATYNPWGTTYGASIQDGTAAWVCVGTANPTAWAAATRWYLPPTGFVPPSPSQSYGSPAVIDTNNVNEFVYNSGKSGSSTPSWNSSPLNSTTTDGTVTWIAVSAFTAVGTSWTTDRGYCYSFYARKASDFVVLNAPPLQIPGTNSPNPLGPLGAPTGCGDGTLTTASPVTQLTGGNTGAQVLVSGQGSTDPQFDTVIIFRAFDGNAASGPYAYLTSIPMPPTVGGSNPGTWSIIDFIPDAAESINGIVIPGLDDSFTAPIAFANDPPPGSFGSQQFQASASSQTTPAAGTALQGIVYHQGRLWGFIGNTVFASSGPDAINSNGFTNAWPPAQEFPFNSNVTRLVATPTALLVFLTTDVFLIGGGPAITDYYSQLLAPGVGLLSFNAVAMVLGLPYMFSSDRQLITIDPSGGYTRIGHPIGDKLSAYDPTAAYVTYHSFGDQEHAIFISNGSSEWYRCDPNPAPDGQITGPVWSPRCTISGGFKAINSIETAPGTHQLLIGPTGAGKILARDSGFTTFTDNGAAYSSYFTMGNIVLAHAGQMAELGFIEADFVQVGSQPTVQVLLDELSATNGAQFETISNTFVSDPPKKYGPTATPATMWANRYYFGQTTAGNGGDQTPSSAWCKSLQIKIDFGATDTVQNELLAFTLFGALWAEK